MAVFNAFSGPKEKPTVQIVEIPYGDYPVAEAPEKFVTNKITDKDGKVITTHKGFSKSGELIQVAAYKDDRKHGMQLGIHQGELRKSSWFYDEKDKAYIAITYGSKNQVVSALCTNNFYSEEHERVCGFKAPFTFTQDSYPGYLEVTMNKGVRSDLKLFYLDGALWVHEKFANNKTHRKEFDHGHLMKEKFSEKSGWFERKFNREGRLLEKVSGKLDENPDHAVVYDYNGKEVSWWKIVNSDDGKRKCSLSRSLASGPRPSACP